MENEKLFSTGSVWKSIFSMAIPSIVIIMVMIIYNMTDMFFVGQLGDTTQIASVSIVGPVFSLAMAVALMLGGGGSAVIANAIGAKKIEKAKIYASLCFWGSVIFGIIIGALLIVFTDPLLRFLGTTEDMWYYSKLYLRILALGTPFSLLSTTLATAVRAEGVIKEGMIGTMSGTFTNIILDPLFILGMNLGVAGAAIASVCGQIISCLYFVIFIHKKATVLNFDPRYALKDPLAIFHIIALGLPNAISSVLSGFASTFSNQLVSGYGTNALAAMAASGNVSMIISMLQMGICMGVQPLMAYNFGALNHKRLTEVLKKLTLLCCSVGIVSSVACYFGRGAIISMFLKDPSVLDLAMSLSVFLIAGLPFIGLFYLATNFLQSCEKAFASTMVSLLRQGFVLIPALYIMNHFFDLYGIASAYLIADISCILVSIVLILWQKRNVYKLAAKNAKRDDATNLTDAQPADAV